MRDERVPIQAEVTPRGGTNRYPMVGATLLCIVVLLVFNLFITPPRPAILLKYERWVESLERQDGDGLKENIQPPPKISLWIPGEPTPLVIGSKVSSDKVLRILKLVQEAKLLAMTEPKDLLDDEVVAIEISGGGRTFSKRVSKTELQSNGPALLLVNLMRLFSAEEAGAGEKRSSKRRQ